MTKIILVVSTYCILTAILYAVFPWFPCLGIAFLLGYSNYYQKGKKLAQMSALVGINILSVTISLIIWQTVTWLGFSWITMLPQYNLSILIIMTIGFATLGYLLGYHECEVQEIVCSKEPSDRGSGYNFNGIVA